ncbi:MAG: hypothetical protein HKN04_04185 [Rhodothermaceae bacterium]|nr:hypothetical protein [Rhodothermaceae bacterium]
MDSPISHPTARRTFLQRLSVGTLALMSGGAVARTASPGAAPAAPRLVTSGTDWLDRIRGEHRQVFDIVEPNNGLGAVYALNYLDSYQRVHGLSGDDVTAVAVYRHNAMPLMLNDATWATYKIGEFLSVTDPETNAPATRNIFRTNIILRPGLTYEQMMADRGVVVVACEMALTVYSSLTAEAAGVSPEEAKADWEANLLDGAVLAASGVYAVDQAQQHGCSYCYAG